VSAAWVGGTKQPPYSIHAEKALLGACIVHPEIVPRVGGIVTGGEAFFRAQHGLIFDAVVELAATQPAFDREALAAALVERGVLDEIGGRGYLVELEQGAAVPDTAIDLARQVQEKAMLRSLIDVASDILSEAYAGGTAYKEILAQARSRIEALDPKPVRSRSRAATKKSGPSKKKSKTTGTTKKAGSRKTSPGRSAPAKRRRAGDEPS
jgi:replicative DNA helicase